MSKEQLNTGVSYQERVTDEIIRLMEANKAPWQKPWDGTLLGRDFNPVTRETLNTANAGVYQGFNCIWLTMRRMELESDDPRWLTFNQTKQLGLYVKKGEKGTTISYWSSATKEDKSNEEKRRMFVKYFVVFNAKQIERMEPFVQEKRTIPLHEQAEKIIRESDAQIHHKAQDRACYSPSLDIIALPHRESFNDENGYYATLFHELSHWTGHSSRLDREYGRVFGSQQYAREELRAEIGAFMVATEFGLPFQPRETAHYLNNWIKTLKEDKNEILRACGDAEKIKDYIGYPAERERLRKKEKSEEIQLER